MGFFNRKKTVANENKEACCNEKTKATEAIKTTAGINTTEGIDPEIVAVISAAISSMMGPTYNLVVRNIVRSNDNSPAWAKASRNDVMASRF